MKLTRVLFQQHIGKMFRDHWKVQGTRKVLDHGAMKVLNNQGIEFEDALDVIKVKYPQRVKYELKGYKPITLPVDENHPDYHDEPCFVYGDNSVLLEGTNQAKLLTNTVELSTDSLPLLNEINSDEEHPLHDKLVKRLMESSFLYDAVQEKLPKRTDPLREAWIFPRDLGIPERRINYLVVNRLLQLCSSFSPQLLGKRYVVNGAKFVVPVKTSSGQKILFSVTGDSIVLSENHPSVKISQNVSDLKLPDISPLAPTVSLQSNKFYKFEPHFPVSSDSKLNKIHTVILQYNKIEVTNIFDCPVSKDQILGRSLMQAWSFAMSQAIKENGYQGDSIDPITVQTVHTDGQFFHFSILQLNSTSCDLESPKKNYYWSFPLMNMFDSCSYQKGMPVFEGYNPKVFKTLLAFYNC